MPEEELGERTEPATERRREEARREGQIAYSRDLTAALTLLAAVAGFQLFGEEMLAEAARLVRHCLSDPWMNLEPARAWIELARLTIRAIMAMAPWFATVYGTALVAEYAQAGGVRIAEREFFNPDRLNPITGFQRLFSIRSVARLSIDILKLCVVGSVGFLFLSREMPAISALSSLGFPNIAGYAFDRMVVLGYELSAVLLVLGIADYAYQRYQFERDLRMTRQEVREEQKDIEGDPQIKARRRQIQLRLARQRMIQKVPEAQVVITNPLELAVALKYDVGETDAPVLVAKGAGPLAARIRDLAREHGIPIIENKPLARLLFHRTDLGRMVPEETFVVVAEILAYVYQLTGRTLPPR